MQISEKKWFYLTTSTTTLISAYFIYEIIRKYNKKTQKQKKQDIRKKRSSKTNEKDIQKLEALDPIRSPRIMPKEEKELKTQFNLENFKPHSKNKRIHKIVFTGGPCAGKTTGLAYCADLLRERGFNVYVVPEAATTIALGGGIINNKNLDQEQTINFQIALMKMQMNLEDRFTEIALVDKNNNHPCVILCDRGVMDGYAYTDEDSWQVLLDDINQNVITIRDKRYDAIVHLITAADGAIEFYNTEDNRIRYEINPSEAIRVDKALRKAYSGHPDWLIIDNSEFGFDRKMQKLGEAVLHLLGQPMSLHFYKKFLLTSTDWVKQLPQEAFMDQFVVEDTFLLPVEHAEERRIRRRGQNGSYQFLLFENRIGSDDLKAETKRRITARDYLELNDQRDTSRETVVKTRTRFFWKESNFMLEEFQNRHFCQLIVQAQQHSNNVILPDILVDYVKMDITENEDYQIYNISQKNWKLPQF